MQLRQLRHAVRLVVATLLISSVVALGQTTLPSPVSADVSDGWVNIDVGDRHTCGVTVTSEAFCWGTGNEGQLGDGTTNSLLIQQIPLEVPAPAGVLWASINVGQYHSCAVTDAGDIYCWGNGASGEAGTGDNPPADFYPSPELVVRPAGVTWDSVAAGRARTCSLTTDGDAYCWGRNEQGQLGLGDTADRLAPTLVPRQGGNAWASIDVGVSTSNNSGSQATCGVTITGAGFCWGDDSEGELGNGNLMEATSSPTPIGPPTFVWTVVRTGLHHSCGITSGQLWCWGANQADQLGLGAGADDNYTTPQQVLVPAGVEFIDVDPGSFMTCALSTDGDIYCWGTEGFAGELGDGNETADRYTTPHLVVPPSGIAPGTIAYVSIDVGPQRVCAVDSTGTGWCWGSDSWGALGDDAPNVSKPVPSQVGDRTGGPQDMTFGELSDRTSAEPPFLIRALTTSGLPVEFTAIGGCTVSGRLVTVVSAGVCEITARQPGDADWDAARPITRQFAITEASPTQTIDAGFIPTIVNPGGTSTVTYELAHPIGTVTARNVALSTTFGQLTATGIAANTCTTGTAMLTAGALAYTGGTLNVGDSCQISVEVTAPATGPSFPTSFGTSADRLTSDLGPSMGSSLAILLVDEGSDLEQSIRMPGFSSRLITAGPGPIVIGAVATSGLPVTYAVTGPCTETGGELTITGLGRCEITASQAGDSVYAAAPDANRRLNIVKANQTIDFEPLSDWPVDGGVRVMTATASSGLDVSYAASGACTVTGADVTVTGPGTCTVQARQFGDGDYNGAFNVDQSFEVIVADQIIDFLSLADWGLLDGDRTLVATASSGLVVSLAATGPCSVSGFTLTVSAVGTCTVTASQPGDATTGAAPDVERSFDVLPGDQTIDFAVLGDWPVTDTTRTLAATATSGLSVSFAASGACTVSGSELTITGLGVCGVTASQTGNASYNAALDVIRGFAVVGATQSIDFPVIDDLQLQPTLALAATASSGLDVAFATAGVCSVVESTLMLCAAGTCAITATQPGDAMFAAAVPIERTFEVLRPRRQLFVDGPAAPTLVGTPATFVVDFRTPTGFPEGTGVIRFVVDGGPTEDVDVINGVARWTVTGLEVGVNEVGGSYLGDGNYQPTPNLVPAPHEVITAPLSLTGLPGSVSIGESVTVEASGFEAGEQVTFVFKSLPVVVGTVTSSATGTAALTFAVPDVDAGAHELTATAGRSGLVASAATTLQVVPPTTAPPTTPPPVPTTQPPAQTTQPPFPTSPDPDTGSELPVTGRSGQQILVWAVGVLALGVLAVGATRRRTTRCLV